ncbi:MAG: YitT family protein [Clostridiales bacterium]|nr:YitT family protein [Clostridiales bacterium]
MKKTREQVLEILYNIFKITIGAVVYGIGIQWFYVPVSLVTGGVTGIAMIANLLSGLPVGVGMLMLNIPIFIIAFRKYGFNFMLGSLLGMFLTSVAVDVFSIFPISVTEEPLLAAIFGGLLTGLGIGLIYSANATSGGVDVIAKLFRDRYPYVNIGTFILILDAFVVAAYALIFRRYDNAMYTVIAVFLGAKVIDTVLYGSSQSKLCHIISERSDEIKAAIVGKLHRGVTLLKGVGAYSGQDKQVLLCVVKRQQIVEIKKIIRSIDSGAFVIVTDTRDVFGQGFGNISVDN